MDESQLCVSVGEAARRLGLSRTTLYPLVISGEVPSLLIGHRRLIPVAQLTAWVDRQAEQASAGRERAL